MILRFAQMVAVALASIAGGPPIAPAPQAPLAPTAHAALPGRDAEALWFAPGAAEGPPRAAGAAQALGSAVRAYGAADYEGTLKALPRAAAEPALAEYVEYYRGLAQLRLKRLAEALASARRFSRSCARPR